MGIILIEGFEGAPQGFVDSTMLAEGHPMLNRWAPLHSVGNEIVAGRTGGNAISLPSSSTHRRWEMQDPIVGVSRFIVGFAFRAHSSSSYSILQMLGFSPNTLDGFNLRPRYEGLLAGFHLSNSNTTLIHFPAADFGGFNIGEWMYVELGVDLVSGDAFLIVDGGPRVEGNADLSSYSIDGLSFGKKNETRQPTTDLDDLYLIDLDAPGAVEPLGHENHVVPLPLITEATVQLDPVGAATNLDAVTALGDDAYVSGGTGKYDTYKVDASSVEGQVHAVSTHFRHRKSSEEGTRFVESIKSVEGAITTLEQQESASDWGDSFVGSVSEDSSTGTKWTQQSIGEAEFGVRMAE